MNWQLEVYQWLVPLITLYYIVRTIKQYNQGKYSPRNTVIWVLFWVFIALLAFTPDRVTNSIARTLGFKDHINALIFVALAILTIMLFYLSAAINRIENKITELARRIAFEKDMKDNISYTRQVSDKSVNKESKQKQTKKQEFTLLDS